tara:strand:- start:1444 stop:2403 length:960 start_codon:yes stop_codon:yes gene_type:complete
MPEFINKKNLSQHYSLKLFGLKGYFHDFINVYKLKKMPKVILLTGEKGIGKFTLSFHLINYILSIGNAFKYDLENLEINNKNNFYNLILSNICENFIYISNENTKKTSIEDIRNIKKNFTTTSFNNLPRFTILDDVDLLNINAANSLLKLIEEPSENNYFILINNGRKKLIETIKSRAIETKIFLNNESKKNIFSHLIKYHNLEHHFTHDFLSISTPGKIIKFSENLKSLPIDLNSSLFDASKILIDKYKKDKNDVFLESLNFLIEIKFFNKINTKDKKFINILNFKKNLMGLLYDYKNFNLSSNIFLDYVKEKEYYAK